METRALTTFRNEIASLLKSLKPEIRDEFRIEEGDTVPGIQVTIGASIEGNDIAWNYQTGDNSYTGGAYGHPHWAIIYLHRRSNCRLLAQEVVSEILDLPSNKTQ